METEHIVKSFDADLGRVDRLIIEMGGLVKKQVVDATHALIARDSELGEKVIMRDRFIDKIEHDIDKMTIRVIALRQPMAEDLRSLVAALKIATYLERIGDYAKNIAKRINSLSQIPAVTASTNTISYMSTIVQKMIHDVLEAYISRDEKMANDVRLRDEEVDQLHNALFRELLTYMMEDPRNITPCMHLLFIAKNIERMGDHTTGIAEQVYYMACAEMPEEERPKSDKTSYITFPPNE